MQILVPIPHWIAAKRILRYLKGTINIKLVFSNQCLESLTGYTDADYANDRDTRKSVTGYLFTKAGAAVSWNSKRQDTVALSTTEAEYMALATTSQEALWWNGILAESFGKKDGMEIRCDNRSTICLAEKEAGYSRRTKHIDVRYHFVKDKVATKEIAINHVVSSDQLADVFTKPLAKAAFQNARKNLGLEDIQV